jgi:hypothetical protein
MNGQTDMANLTNSFFFMKIQSSFGIGDVCLLGSITGDCVRRVLQHVTVTVRASTKELLKIKCYLLFKDVYDFQNFGTAVL